ncbi:MAG: plastocyanin/azurin family copper-binding protein [Halodesulfurarchaeum sp.]
MHRRTVLRAGGQALAGLGIATLGTGRARAASHNVGMYTEGGAYYFDPIGLFVEPGDTVSWVIKSGVHTTTSYSPSNPGATVQLIPDEAKPWNSGTLTQQGASYEYTFEVPGTYDYYCIPHKSLGMVGRIVCGEPGGPAEQASIPSSDRPKEGSLPSSDVIVEKGSLGYPFTGGGGAGGGGGTPVLGRSVALFGGAGLAAIGLYHGLNSAGERVRVGSSAWRERLGLDREDEGGESETPEGGASR